MMTPDGLWNFTPVGAPDRFPEAGGSGLLPCSRPGDVCASACHHERITHAARGFAFLCLPAVRIPTDDGAAIVVTPLWESPAGP